MTVSRDRLGLDCFHTPFPPLLVETGNGDPFDEVARLDVRCGNHVRGDEDVSEREPKPVFGHIRCLAECSADIRRRGLIRGKDADDAGAHTGFPVVPGKANRDCIANLGLRCVERNRAGAIDASGNDNVDQRFLVIDVINYSDLFGRDVHNRALWPRADPMNGHTPRFGLRHFVLDRERRAFGQSANIGMVVRQAQLHCEWVCPQEDAPPLSRLLSVPALNGEDITKRRIRPGKVGEKQRLG